MAKLYFLFGWCYLALLFLSSYGKADISNLKKLYPNNLKTRIVNSPPENINRNQNDNVPRVNETKLKISQANNARQMTFNQGGYVKKFNKRCLSHKIENIWNLQRAQSFCTADLHCRGVYDAMCDGSSAIHLCLSSTFNESATSCIYQKIEDFGSMENIAYRKSATSSSVAFNGYAEKAVDGKTNNGKYGNPQIPSRLACSRTNDEPSWIRVDLGERYVIAALSIVGRMRGDQDWHNHQSNNWTIRIGNTTSNNSGTICASDVDATGGYWIPVFCNTTLSGRYVTISSEREVVLCEIQVLIKYDENGITEMNCKPYPPYQIVYTSETTIISPHFPNNYPSEKTCELTIMFEEEERVLIQFESFNIEMVENHCFDYLNVHDGNTSSSNLIGSEVCGDIKPAPINSSGNSLTLIFHTDYFSNGDKGFKLKAYSIVDGGWREDNFTQCNKTCGGGIQTQEKFCDDPAPRYNGSVCACNKTNAEIDPFVAPFSDEGDSKEKFCDGRTATIQRICNIQPCPVHGGWSNDDDFSVCNATCGEGMKNKTKHCNNPSPAHEGNSCSCKNLTETVIYCNNDTDCI